jgi:hypothetical protein
VNLSLQRDPPDPRLLADGFSILNDVRIDHLISLMLEGDIEYYREDKFIRRSLDFETTRILSHWLNGEKLIPPTMMVYTKEILGLFEKGDIIPSTEIFPADGKHRLSLAHYLGVKTIPILVFNIQLTLLSKMLRT